MDNDGVSDNSVVLVTDTAYDCCVACQQNPDCGGAYYTLDTVDFAAGGPGTCTIDEPSGSCNPQYVGVQYAAYEPTYMGATLIDGNCGIIGAAQG